MTHLEEVSEYTYEDIVKIDSITVDTIPEKKGLFRKHVEYTVRSRRFDSEVYRRYNDFVALYELLLSRFPYRLIPKLPPKKIVGGDSEFLEDRRQGLERWLTFIARHPVISKDAIIHYFLTQSIQDIYTKMKEVFRSVPDEFGTSELSSKAKELVPPDNHNEFSSSREQIRAISQGISKIKMIADQIAMRSNGYAFDMCELGNQLMEISIQSGNNSNWGTGGNNTWSETRTGLGIISKEFLLLSTKASEQAKREEEVCKKLSILIDVLGGHHDLCERVEKGVSHDHQSALTKMLNLKKRQIQDVLRGSDVESVAALQNKMLQQEMVIASVELRTAFSLYCVRLETQLVHAYLETIAQVFNSLVSVQVTAHTELAEVWKSILPSVSKCLPKKSDVD